MENQEKTSENQVIRNEKGQIISGSGNPNGRPKGVKNLTTKVKEALEKIADGQEYTYEEALVKRILNLAIIKGNPRMIELLWAYMDGKPNQTINVNDITNKYKHIEEMTEEELEEYGNNIAKQIGTDKGDESNRGTEEGTGITE